MRTTTKYAALTVMIACFMGLRANDGLCRQAAPRVASPVGVWRSSDSNERALSLEFARGLLARGLAEAATKELDALEPQIATESSSLRARFGALASLATIESTSFATPGDCARVRERLGSLRALAEGAASSGYDYFSALTEGDAEGLAYALALARSYEILGAFDDAEESESAFEFALEVTKILARSLPANSARPFLYRHASILLATGAPDRLERAEKFADALCKRQRALDEYYFFARLMQIRIARERGDGASASSLIGETLDALQGVSDRFDAPREISVALVAEEIRALLLEGKSLDALRQAARETDLRDAPFPENTGRYSVVFYDVFDDWELARLEAYCAALASGAAPDELEEFDSLDAFRSALLAESRSAVERMTSSVTRTRASRLMRATGELSGDFDALRASGDELYRARKWRAALEAYDSASSSARESGSADVARQLDQIAAALVDKICREKLYESEEFEERSAEFWRRDAARRFEALSRAQPSDANSPDFYLLALEYRENTPEDSLAARLEFLTLFPEAPQRASYALTLARKALAESNVEVAEQALDCVPVEDAHIVDALALERACCRARLDAGDDRDAAITRTLARVFDRFGIGAASQSPVERGAVLAPSANGAAILETTLALALDSALIQNERFQDAALRALEAQREAEASADRRAALDALRLSLALAADRGDDALAILNATGENANGASLELVERLLNYAARSDVSADARRRAAEFALDATERGASEHARRRVLRAEALRLLARYQEALNLFAAALKENPKDVAATRGIAQILSLQSDKKALERALSYWSDVADLVPDGSKEWWDAKESTLDVYRRLGNKEQAQKMTSVLWLTRSDPSDPSRKRRWEKIVQEMK